WTPVDTWHFNASGRYNETQTKNKIAARYGRAAYGIGDLIASPNKIDVCPNGDCSNVPVNYTIPRIFNALGTAEAEKFSYYSFNPQLGLTWQAKENLNLFANWAKGTRTPSVIELGCALDKTPGTTPYVYYDENGSPVTYYQPKSVEENRQCTLPTTLSGDPFLPQIKATTYDIGARGAFNSFLGAENIQWNLGAYQTDLKDDIYFVAVGNGAGFFDSIGKTRRRGLEAGLSGKRDKLSFSLNYGLTDATFQDNFLMISADNSSAIELAPYGSGVIKVKSGDRMPGVPLHNLNANISYEVTPKWQVGLSAVVHSTSYVRGNENNEHKVGVIQYVSVVDANSPTGERLVAKVPTSNPGS
ncbi:MAG: TonB-dependent receptor, partial [Methylotenera sp.]